MIKMFVIGNLGRDCTTNVVNGKNVINFTVAHSERGKDASGNPREKVIWVDCAYWTERTGIAPYLKKGQQVYVEGAPDIRVYTRNDGSNGASLTLRVSNVQLLGSAQQRVEEERTMESGRQESGEPHALAAASTGEGASDDLPF